MNRPASMCPYDPQPPPPNKQWFKYGGGGDVDWAHKKKDFVDPHAAWSARRRSINTSKVDLLLRSI